MSHGSAEAGGLRGRPSQRPGRGPRTRFRAAPPSHLRKQPLYPRAGLPHGAKAAAAAPTARRDVSTAERTSFPELLLSGPTSVEQTTHLLPACRPDPIFFSHPLLNGFLSLLTIEVVLWANSSLSLWGYHFSITSVMQSFISMCRVSTLGQALCYAPDTHHL